MRGSLPMTPNRPVAGSSSPAPSRMLEAKKVFRESYQQAQSGANRGKVLVLENGMKFHEVGVTNRDAQFLELRKFQITDIARSFRVPPHMIADLDRATFSNIEQKAWNLVMPTMTPWAERWEASIESELMLDDEELEVEFDFANLMRGDAASRAAYYQSGIQNGWLTRIEYAFRRTSILSTDQRAPSTFEHGREGAAGNQSAPVKPNNTRNPTMKRNANCRVSGDTVGAGMPERLNAVASVLYPLVARYACSQ